MASREDVEKIFAAALAAVDPYQAVISWLRSSSHPIVERLRGNGHPPVVFAAGKAAAPMAHACLDLAGGCSFDLFVLTKDGHSLDLGGERTVVMEAAHPVPDERSLKAADLFLQQARKLTTEDAVIFLLSGGASSLLCRPAEGLTLKDMQMVTTLLLRAGADIDEVNAVRKHMSRVKGGLFARALDNTPALSLLLSDVIGDKLETIGSGPLVPDPYTWQDVATIVERYGLKEEIPSAMKERLTRGLAGEVEDTPKKGEPCFSNKENVIVGSNGVALAAARRKAEELGYVTTIFGENVTGIASEVAHDFSLEALRRQPLLHGKSECLLLGGETTVVVNGDGLGGRNQEFALASAVALQGSCGVVVGALGTDGTDGPTDAAGGIVDGDTVARCGHHGTCAESALANNDSYTALKAAQDLVVTGPTRTNVNDIAVALFAAPSPPKG